MSRAPGEPYTVSAYGNLSLFHAAPNVQEIYMNFFVQDAVAAIPALHARREAFADELVAIALRYNTSFIMDWVNRFFMLFLPFWGSF